MQSEGLTEAGYGLIERMERCSCLGGGEEVSEGPFTGEHGQVGRFPLRPSFSLFAPHKCWGSLG